MANVVEKLFDSVLSSLTKSDSDTSDTQKHKNESDDDAIYEIFESEDDLIITSDKGSLIRQVRDKLSERWDKNDPSPEERDVFEGGIRDCGFDVLAFYKSRRFIARRPYPGKWGIFYLTDGLNYLAVKIHRVYPGHSDPHVLAYEFLREHERFHYRADIQTLMFEATTGRHLYQRVRNAFCGRRSYFVEEALANRQAWDWSKRKNISIDDFAFDFMKSQPGAYSRFDEARLNLAGEWAANVVDLNVSNKAMRSDLSYWVEATPQNLLRPSLCPEYIVCQRSNIKSWVDKLRDALIYSQIDGSDSSMTCENRHTDS